MGLGKTVQAVSFISYLINVQQITRPFLIVVPLSTIENWVREFTKWCPEARVVKYMAGMSHNYDKARPACRSLEFYFTMETKAGQSPYLSLVKVPKFNVLLVPYHLFVSDYTHLAKIPWKCVIIDEGQRLKSNNTQIFKLALTLITEHRILLSGTPLQNNIGELFNLLEYLDPVKFCQQTRENFNQMFAESLMLKDTEKIFTKQQRAKN